MLFTSDKDIAFINNINVELLRDIIDTNVTIYKISLYETENNLYGESIQKRYYPGIEVPCVISNEPQNWNENEFGTDLTQNVMFAFHREYLKQYSLYPEVGDIIEYNETYFEINSIVENQLIAGRVDLTFSIVCNTHRTRLDKINIEEYNFGEDK